MISRANWTDFSSIEGGNALATMNRVLPPWVSLFLVIVIGWQLAKIIWLLVPAPATGDAIQSPISIPVAASQATGSADVQIIANNHMFGEASTDSAAIAPEPVADDNLSDTRLTNLVLKGTIATVIADGTAEQNVYAIGDAVGSGTTLHAVYAERVVLNENGVLTNLRLPSEFPDGQARPVRRTTSVSRSATRNDDAQSLREPDETQRRYSPDALPCKR
jgi:general secretion pathway protein C